MYRAFGQIEGVAVPFEDGRPLADGAQHRIGAPGVCRRDMVPAEFARRPKMVLRPVGAGQKLPAKADPQNRPAIVAVSPHQRGQPGKIGVAVIVQRALFAAKHDKTRVTAHVAGQAAIVPGAPDVDQRARLGQRDADLAKMRNLGILDDRDAHDTLSPWAASRQGPGKGPARD